MVGIYYSVRAAVAMMPGTSVSSIVIVKSIVMMQVN